MGKSWHKAFLAAVLGVMLGADAHAQSLRIGIAELPAGYGDPYTAIGLPGSLVWQQIFDSLTKIDHDGALVGALAESWRMVDPLTWCFRLRKGVRYANGAPFDAHAAKAVLDWLASADGRTTIVGSSLTGIAAVEATESHELVIRTAAPDPILPKRLTIAAMVEPESWLSLGSKAFSRQPIGTGSYVLRSWQSRNGAAELVANAFAWQRPAIGTVEVYPLTDHAARFQAAISQQLHAAISMRPEDLDAFRKRGFSVYVDPTKQIIGLAFDVEGHAESPIADVRVRQALNMAVDRDAISDIITAGAFPPAKEGASPGVFGYNPDVEPFPYDPTRARALLAAAGYPDGFTLSASVVTGTYSSDVEIYQKVQQDLGAIGVQLVIEATVFSDWIQQYAFGHWRSEAFSLAWNSTPFNDALRPMEYFSCKKPRPFFCDESMMPLIEAASTELDPVRRERLLMDLQVAFHEQAPQLFLLEYGHIWVASDELTNFEIHDRVPQLWKVRFRAED